MLSIFILPNEKIFLLGTCLIQLNESNMCKYKNECKKLSNKIYMALVP